MQQFTNIQSSETLANSRQELLNNDLTVMSCSSGTAFPTTNLQQGMFCYRTDLFQLFQLKDLTPTWSMVFDLTQVATNKAYVDGQIATCVPSSNVTTTATANKLLQLNSSGQLPASITGNAATATSAGSASSVPWSGITGLPATFTPPVATASILGGVKQGSNITIAGDGTISAPTSFGFGNTSSFSASTQAAYTPSWSASGSAALSISETQLTVANGVGAGSYSLQTVLQNLINLSHTHGVVSRSYSNCCSCGGCFIYGTLVRMADGTLKKIETVKAGERVLGLNGINTVIDAVKMELSERTSLMRFEDNSLVFTGSHLLWTKNLEGKEGFAVHDYSGYLTMKKYRYFDTEKGNSVKYIGLTKGEPHIVTEAVDFAHVEGWKRQIGIFAREFLTGTPICTLIVDGDHTFTANGYVVAGGPRDDDFDYSCSKWSGLGTCRHD